MKFKEFITLLVPNIVVILIAYFTIAAGNRLQEKGSTPEKKLIIVPPVPISPLEDLSPLAAQGTVSLKIGDRLIDNLQIMKTVIKNTGSSPIMPADFFEPIAVQVKEPWEIISARDNSSQKSQPALHWRKISNQKFSADPTLINPGDVIVTTIYLTSAKAQSPAPASSPDAKPNLEWSARITNLKSFSTDDFDVTPLVLSIKSIFEAHVYVILNDWNLLFTFCVGIINCSVMIYLLAKRKFIPKIGWKSIAIIALVMILSTSTAEAVKTYLFGDLVTNMFSTFLTAIGDSAVGVNHSYNAPPIVVDAIVLLLLINMPFKKRVATV